MMFKRWKGYMDRGYEFDDLPHHVQLEFMGFVSIIIGFIVGIITTSISTLIIGKTKGLK